MASEYEIPAREKAIRPEETRLNIVITGAGLGGLGCAISCLLSGHSVTILESSPSIHEIGAGIQVLPNASRILSTWGVRRALSRHATYPSCVNFSTWAGTPISSMNFAESARNHGGRGTGYWDFHRADLHACLLERARELGAVIRTGCRVVDISIASSSPSSQSNSNSRHNFEGEPSGPATALLSTGQYLSGDLIIGADGINSTTRTLLQKAQNLTPDAPIPTGDLAYRLLLPTAAILSDPELRSLITSPQVNYWLGPQKHAVNYVLRNGELFNMVLLVPDDMPSGTSTLAGDVAEMKALFEGWDPRICRLLDMCQSSNILKWKLCIRAPLQSWSHASHRFTILGDAAHATLPYLASGAGMSLEDGEVLGLCLGRMRGKGVEELGRALRVYERVRKGRTERVVERGNTQQWLYHLEDGAEQEERDRRMREWPTREGEALAWRDPGLGPWLLGYDCAKEVEEYWPNEDIIKEERLAARL